MIFSRVSIYDGLRTKQLQAYQFLSSRSPSSLIFFFFFFLRLGSRYSEKWDLFQEAVKQAEKRVARRVLFDGLAGLIFPFLLLAFLL